MDNRLYNRRKELGLTLEEVGQICNVGKSTVRKWEKGLINNMGRDNILKLSKALQVSPLFILQAESIEKVLSKYDLKLLSYTDELTQNGREKVLDYAKDLSANPLYCIQKHLLVNAAHERTDIEITDEMRAYDDSFFDKD